MAYRNFLKVVNSSTWKDEDQKMGGKSKERKCDVAGSNNAQAEATNALKGPTCCHLAAMLSPKSQRLLLCPKVLAASRPSSCHHHCTFSPQPRQICYTSGHRLVFRRRFKPTICHQKSLGMTRSISLKGGEPFWNEKR